MEPFLVYKKGYSRLIVVIISSNMLLALATVLFVLLQATESSAYVAYPESPEYTCTFHRGTRQVTCGGVTCTTQQAGWFSGSLLPAGTYRIGPLNTGKSVTWYNLYPYSDGKYWDYNSKVPGLGCRGGFALHGGSYSEGCITVTNDDCMDQIASHLNGFSASSFQVNECNAIWGPNCLSGRCRNGIGTLTRSYICSLKVYP